MTDNDERRGHPAVGRGGLERGAVAVMMGLLIVILCGAGAFAIDAGLWYRQSSAIQKATDVASLAGARVRGQGGTLAEIENAVYEALAANGYDVSGGGIDLDVTLVGSSDVQVKVAENDVDLLFAGMFVDDIDLVRTSTSSFGACLGPCETQIVIAPPINFTLVDSEGDGYQPVIVGNRIYTVNHHLDSWDTRNALMCVDLATEATCAGYPQLPEIVTPDHPLIVHDTATNRIWFGHQTLAGGSMTYNVECWDTAPVDASCGRIPLGTWTPKFRPGPRDFENYAVGPFEVGGRIYFFDANHDVHCIDMATTALCAGYPTQTGGAATIGANSRWIRPADASDQDALVVGTRIYHTHSSDLGPYVGCWDTATAAPCVGWATPLRFDDTIAWGVWLNHLFPSMDPSGVVNGMCLYTNDVGNWDAHIYCISLDGTTRFFRDDLNAPGRLPDPNDRMLMTELVIGTRMYVSNLWTNGVFCVDLASGASCGYLDTSTNGPSGARPYAFDVVDDSGCIVGLGDSARLYSFTADMGACPTGEGTARILPCTCADGTVFWGQIEFEGTLLSNFTSFVVTVRDPGGNIVAGPQDLITGSPVVDLSGVAETVPYLDVEFDAEVPPLTNWKDPIVGSMIVTERPALRN